MTPVELRIARRRAGLSQKQLSELLEVSAQSVWRWEAGDVAIPLRVELALSVVLTRAWEAAQARWITEPAQSWQAKVYRYFAGRQ